MKIRLISENEIIAIESEYNKDFKDELKSAEAKWNGTQWCVKYQEAEKIKDILNKYSDSDMTECLKEAHDLCILTQMYKAVSAFTSKEITKGVRNEIIANLREELLIEEVRQLAFELEIKGLKYVNQLQNLFNEKTN